MAKPSPKKFQPPVRPGQPPKKQAQQATMPVVPALSPVSSFKAQSILLIIIGAVIYFNACYMPFSGPERQPKYALDDDIVMRLNDYVQQGFAGIGKIMTTDSYDSFFKSMGSSGELSGGRYRPLSILTFAIEQQLFGECYGTQMLAVRDSMSNMQMMQMNPALANKLIGEKAYLESKISASHEDLAMIRHIVSVLLYILSIVLLLKLLRDYVFKYANLKFINHTDLAFIATLIFLVHPLHTEVVANVKSRDEILSFLFIVLTFIYVFSHTESKQPKDLYLGLLFFFLALLSKEWAITLAALIPLSLYIFRRFSIAESIKTSLPYIGVFLLYVAIRYKCVGEGKTGEITEPLNNPFVFATAIQAKATQIFILIKYLFLLIWPTHLSADYSWKTIPYSSFGDALVWVSIFVHAAIVYYFVVLLKKRSWIAFAIAFYLSHLFLVSNLAKPIGATMGERLIYHSSLGFIMVAAFGLLTLLTRLIPSRTETERSIGSAPSQTEEGSLTRKLAFVALLIMLVVPMGYKTMERNPDWETDNILFMHDAWVVPNSVLANGNSGKAFIEYAQKDTVNRRNFLDSAIYHLDKAVALHPKYVNGYLNLGLAWFQKRDLDKAEYFWNQARRNFPTHPFFRQSYDPALANAFVENARQEGQKGNVPKAIEFIARALRYDSSNAETWYHYGGANYSIGKVNEAYRGWSKCLQINPNHAEAKKGLAILTQQANPANQTQQQATNNTNQHK